MDIKYTNEQIVETRICKRCGKEFNLDKEDVETEKRIDFKTTLCDQCHEDLDMEDWQ